MTVYFGTIEYFERELSINLPNKERADQENLAKIFEKMEDELLHDFICDEEIRGICLENLAKAYERLLHQADRMDVC
jgi:hypothetical protein